MIKSQKISENVNILDTYIKKKPDRQNMLDLFSGEWSSKMPQGSGLITQPGNALLFDDIRVKWAAEVFGGFKDLTILELGPLEAGHSYMLHHMGAKKVTSIEANSRCFLKCLCIKEIFNLNNVEFKLGDFVPFIKDNSDRYDAVIASGVLYHMFDPIDLIESLSKLTNKIFIWTHYYDEGIIKNNPNLSHKFGTIEQVERNGIAYEWVEQSYKDALKWAGFCGGSAPTSRWLTRDSLIKLLNSVGFSEIAIEFDDPTHPHGPSLAICAQKP